MKIIEFAEMTTVFATTQPEYSRLPARVESDGVVTSCYELSWKEIWHMIWYGKRRMWLQIMTFGDRLQPQRPSVVKPVWTQVYTPQAVPPLGGTDGR